MLFDLLAILTVNMKNEKYGLIAQHSKNRYIHKNKWQIQVGGIKFNILTQGCGDMMDWQKEY